MSAPRVLVAAGDRLPAVALRRACALAGPRGELVLAAVMVVPHAQPLDATLDRAVADACAVLDAGERAACGVARWDTRLLRARSFSEGVLDAMAAEPFDLLVLEITLAGLRDARRAQVEALVERARSEVVLVRPRRAALTP